MEGTHVLMLVSNHVSHDPRVLNEARTLRDHGARVTVLGWDRAGAFPAEEDLDGVRVVRVRNTAWMRLLRIDLLRLRPLWRLLARRGRALHADGPVDVVHAHDLDTLPAGVRLERALGVPLVYDAHEVYGYMVAKDLPWPLPGHFLRKERRLLRRVDHLVTENERRADYFRSVAPPGLPVTVVRNAKPVDDPVYRPPENDDLVAIYVGTLNPSRLIEGLVDAVDGLDGVRLVIAGVGHDDYVRLIERRVAETDNAAFLGRIPQDEVLPRTRRADVVLCMADPTDPNNRMVGANKQFEAMACGRPIVTSRGTYPGDFTDEHGVGLVVEHSAAGVREALVRLRDDPKLREELGRRALERAVDRFHWEAQADKLVGVYEDVLGRARSTGDRRP